MSLITRISDLTTRLATEFKSVKTIISGNSNGILTSLTTTVKTSILEAINSLKSEVDSKQDNLGFTPEDAANRGSANGYAPLDAGSKVPAAYLPSYVDDIVDGTFTNSTTFAASGNQGVEDGDVTPNPQANETAPQNSVIYSDVVSNLLYRWSGSSFVTTSGALALGETSTTAHRGDHGNIAYNHSQVNDANPHETTFVQLKEKPTTINGFGITDSYTKTEIGNITNSYVSEFEAAL
tara:strand:- start:702 stop:1412 length:711 start_codon:yes stop_codon:yes gene_type:complete